MNKANKPLKIVNNEVKLLIGFDKFNKEIYKDDKLYSPEIIHGDNNSRRICKMLIKNNKIMVYYLIDKDLQIFTNGLYGFEYPLNSLDLIAKNFVKNCIVIK